MAKHLAHLCSERHYMGSSSSGRYATDRSLRPSYEHLPDPAAHAQGIKARAAHHTRYLREQNVPGWVLACEQAKSDLAHNEALRDALHGRLTALPDDSSDRAAVEQALALVETRLDQALARRKNASRQLRLIGISPKAQARIFAELRRRVEVA